MSDGRSINSSERYSIVRPANQATIDTTPLIHSGSDHAIILSYQTTGSRDQRLKQVSNAGGIESKPRLEASIDASVEESMEASVEATQSPGTQAMRGRTKTTFKRSKWAISVLDASKRISNQVLQQRSTEATKYPRSEVSTRPSIRMMSLRVTKRASKQPAPSNGVA